MIVNLKLSDELFEHYVKKFGLPKAYLVLKQAAEYFKNIDLNERYLIIAGDERRELEAIFQTTLDTPAKLIKLLKNMNTFKLGDVEIAFSDDELARLHAQAGFHGRTMDQFVYEMAKEIKDRMLESV